MQQRRKRGHRCAAYAALIFLCVSPIANTAEEFPAVDCVIQPYEVVDLGSPASGVIDEILVERSERVSRGQAVARMEDSVEVATVRLARARAKVDAQLEIEQTNNSYDKKIQRRIESLYGRKVVPVDSKDAADREARLSELRLSQVYDLQADRERELERAEELVRQKTIRSTIDGFVIDQFKSPGEFVEDQPILRIAQLDPLNVDAIVPMSYFGRIRPGMRAQVSHELSGGEVMPASVTLVDRIGDAASGTFGVRLELTNSNFDTPAGLKCEVRFLETPAHVMAKAEKKWVARQTPTRYVAGPFSQESQYQSLIASLKGLDHETRAESVSEVENYMVMAAPKSSDRIRELHNEQHLDDFRALHNPPYSGYFSLGVYSTYQRAVARQDRLSELGVDTQLVPREGKRFEWWIDIVVFSAEQSDRLQVLKEAGNPIEVVPDFVGN